MASSSAELDVQTLARLAAASLVAEARLTPKPGLVDQRNTGAHTDMDLATFMASAAALEPLFAEYVRAGREHAGANAAELADILRRIGIRAEGAMFSATGGINTHKGANFMFALVLGAAGAVSHRRGDAAGAWAAADTAATLELVSAMGESLLGRDVRALLSCVRTGGARLTHGETVYLEQGLKGARGEAAQGYPLLREVLLPYLREHGSAAHADARDLLLRALVKLMARLEDTNVVHRGGMQALVDHRAFCGDLDGRDLEHTALIDELIAYDDELIAKNVSPGGAADLISLGIFFGQIEGILAPSDLAY